MRTILKKIIAVLLALGIALSLSGCNRQIVDLNYKFDYAIIQIKEGELRIPVQSWTDYQDSDMIQVVATDGSVYYTHASRVILVKE